MQYLVFRLYGPMVSWGEIAVGESRHSAAYPGKSALLGLIGAALGVRREDTEVQNALARGYKFAVKVLSTGYLLRDYHTTQVPDSTGKAVYQTRQDEIIRGRERLGTILSNREYRCDALCLVAVSTQPSAPFTLQELRDGLLCPRFHLYLGRKSCPAAAPLNPIILETLGAGEALDSYFSGGLFLSDTLMRKVGEQMDASDLIDLRTATTLNAEDQYALRIGKEPLKYYWEGNAGDLQPQQSLIRHDQPVSRTRWQFLQRAENLLISKEDS